MIYRIVTFIAFVAALAGIGQIPVVTSAEAEATVVEIPVPAADLARCEQTLAAVMTAPTEGTVLRGDSAAPTVVRCVAID